MKRSLLFLGIAALAFSISSCKKYKDKEVYANCPVYMDYEDFRNSFELQSPTMIENAGNIYVHNNYIFINDIDKGIQIYDNLDPYNCYPIGFLNIPGNTQMAVNNSTLYADSFMDLLTIDISNIHDPKLISRNQEVFSYSLPMINEGYPIADIDKSQGVVIDWEVKKTKEVSGFMAKFNVKDCSDCDAQEIETKNAVSANVNLAGSMSQFAIIDNHLYALDGMDIKSFNVANPNNTIDGATRRTWAEPETFFPHGDMLMVGTTTGLMIYDASADRDQPVHVSTFEHVESCDPVVADGDYAYVTLRSGSDCGGEINELQVVDISDPYWPTLASDFDMYDPHGLAKDGNLLFICDGDEGLKIFDCTSPEGVGYLQMYQYENIQTKDIIAHNGVAIMIAENGIYLYDYTDPGNIFEINGIVF